MHNQTKPFFSIVIPSYNHGTYLRCAIDSVLSQSFQSWEAIVVDNYSVDGTDQILDSYCDPRIIKLKIRNNGVIAVSRNAGILVARGDWVAFLDSDDWWKKNKLEVCFNSVSETVDLIYHSLNQIYSVPSKSWRRENRSWQLSKPILRDLLINGNCLANSSVVVRRRYLQIISGMSEKAELVGGEDYNTWLKIATYTNCFIYLDEALGYYRVHQNNISKRDPAKTYRTATAEFLPLLSWRDQKMVSAVSRFYQIKYSETSTYSLTLILDAVFVAVFSSVSIKMRLPIVCLLRFSKYLNRRT